MELFHNQCAISALPSGVMAKTFNTFKDDLHNTMYIHTAPEQCLKMLVIGNLEQVYEIGRSFWKDSFDITYNPKLAAWECYAAYLD